jgi:ElaB/YqjD/DUF883 family membrane-anchored ribosome-binding protein
MKRHSGYFLKCIDIFKGNKMENSTSKPDSDTSGAVQRGVDSAGAALHSTIDKVADPARDTVDRVSTAAHETVDKLASEASHAADRFSEHAHWVSEAPGRALDCSKSWVQDKPLEAVGIALALGFIVGRLTAR